MKGGEEGEEGKRVKGGKVKRGRGLSGMVRVKTSYRRDLGAKRKLNII